MNGDFRSQSFSKFAGFLKTKLPVPSVCKLYVQAKDTPLCVCSSFIEPGSFTFVQIEKSNFYFNLSNYLNFLTLK